MLFGPDSARNRFSAEPERPTKQSQGLPSGSPKSIEDRSTGRAVRSVRVAPGGLESGVENSIASPFLPWTPAS